MTAARVLLAALFALPMVAGAPVASHAQSALADEMGSIAETCVAARADYQAALASFAQMGWTPAPSDKIDGAARAMAEMGHLGGLKTEPGQSAPDKTYLAERIADIKRDIPKGVVALRRDFPGVVMADDAKQRAVLTPVDGTDRFLVINMGREALNVCGVLAAQDAGMSEPPDPMLVSAVLAERLEPLFADAEVSVEVGELAGPRSLTEISVVFPGSPPKLTTSYMQILRPKRIALHTDYVFWTGYVFVLLFH